MTNCSVGFNRLSLSPGIKGQMVKSLTAHVSRIIFSESNMAGVVSLKPISLLWKLTKPIRAVWTGIPAAQAEKLLKKKNLESICSELTKTTGEERLAH